MRSDSAVLQFIVNVSTSPGMTVGCGGRLQPRRVMAVEDKVGVTTTTHDDGGDNATMETVAVVVGEGS